MACKNIFIQNIYNFWNKFKLDYDCRETLLAELSFQNIDLDGGKNNERNGSNKYLILNDN